MVTSHATFVIKLHISRYVILQQNSDGQSTRQSVDSVHPLGCIVLFVKLNEILKEAGKYFTTPTAITI